MARSKRTLKEEIQAQKYWDSLKDKNKFYPIVTERKPYNDDFHPLNKHQVKGLLRAIPKKYVYGLKKIELCRRNRAIGDPFGLYDPLDKKIILFSLPLVWNSKNFNHINSWIETAKSHNCHIQGTGEQRLIIWSRMDLDLWFAFDVFFHEIGHHFVEQYKRKNKMPRDYDGHEFMADLHGYKITKGWMRRILHKRG